MSLYLCSLKLSGMVSYLYNNEIGTLPKHQRRTIRDQTKETGLRDGCLNIFYRYAIQ